MNRPIYIILLVIFISWACHPKSETKEESTTSINFWYGDNQSFGHQGVPQKWINILGNIKAEKGIKNSYYKLNDEDSVVLSLGSDLHRLANQGDFNIDFAFYKCKVGQNKVQVFVTDSAGFTTSKTIKFQVSKDNLWPLPYSIKWSEVENIQDAVQVIDGNWIITELGLHNLDTYYDRIVALGDSTWKNYEVKTSVIFHDFTPPAKGPPTYNVSHAAIASRWPGHSKDDLQPYRKWYPLGATSEFRLTAGLDSCRWRIFDGPKPNAKKFYVEQSIDNYRFIELNKVYRMKHRVESIGNKRTKYSVKLWPSNRAESDDWDFSGIENDENLNSGSTLLIAHNTSVTFGDVEIRPIKVE